MRRAVVEAIVKDWKDYTDNLSWLKDRALNDEKHYVRRTALQKIAKDWKDDSDTLPWLKDRALNDQNYEVRRLGVQEIAQGWKDAPQTFDFLCDRAIHDPFKREKDWQDNPRQTALEAILKHYSEKSQTLELLKAVSNNDRDEELKEFAKEELAKLSKNPVGA